MKSGSLEDDTQLWVLDVSTAARANDWDKAVRLADYALSRGIEHARLLQVRAIGRERTGRLTEALADLERAHLLDPDDIGVANALGLLLTQTGRAADAVMVLDKAAAAAPAVPDTWRNLAAAHRAAGDIAASRAAYEQALTLDTSDAVSLGKLAVLAAHRGDATDARTLAVRALAIDPANPDARRARIEADIDDKHFAEAETAARDWLTLTGLGPSGRHHALGLLADALEGQGKFAEAFEAYGASGLAFKAAHGKTFAPLDAAPLRESFNGMERSFAEISPAVWNAAGRAAGAQEKSPRSHVFLMGFMRSGTTLLEQALGHHPDVATLEEVEAFAQAGADRLWTVGGMQALARLTPDDARAMRATYWAEVERRGVTFQGKVFIDKLPFNGAKLPLIAALFPQAKVLFAVRDPRDVVLSCFQKRLQPNAYAYEMSTLDGAARLYAAYMKLVHHYRAMLPLQILDHRHEDLIADFERTVREACSFIDLDFRPEMTAFHASSARGEVMSQTARQLGQGLNARGVGRWRSYAMQIAPVLPLLRPWAEHYGYAPD